MKKIARLSVAAIGLLAACAPLNTPITATGTTTPSSFAQGIADANFNLQGAISVGALPANDKLAACVAALVPPAPAAGTTVKSFVPKTGSLEADAAILYIRSQQAQAQVAAGLDNASCDALVGHFIIQTVQSGASILASPLTLLK